MRITALAFLLVAVSCKPAPEKPTSEAVPPEDSTALLRVGSVLITEADLDYHLREKHAGRKDADTRQKALDELGRRARFTQAALDAGLESDPMTRAEIARILTNRLKETVLGSKLKEVMTEKIPESRLREIYQADTARYQSNEKRQLAVLWLNPGANPERVAQYQEKLKQAREWFSNNDDLKAHPDQGFSVLGVDYSEHAASRFKSGVVGWLEREGGMDSFSKAVAEIGFTLKDTGEVSEVVTRPEGVFLVRLMTLKSGFLRPFESVVGELEQAERQRLRKAAEADFDIGIEKKYPIELLRK